MKSAFLSLSFLLILIGVSAQIIELSPTNPNTNSDIVITYNAALGNGVLKGYTSNVYAHTGLITSESENGSDWKHVVSDWGTDDNKVLMQKIGDDLYQISYNIADFYNINSSQENVLKLAFVFRNEDGSIVGKGNNNSDIYYPINIKSAGDYLSHSFDENGLIIITTEGELSLQAYTSSIIRIAFTPEFTSPNDTSYSVVLQSQQAGFTVENNDNYLMMTTEDLEIKIEKSPIKTSFYKDGNLICSEETGFYNQPDRQGIRLLLTENEQLQGTGSRAIPINRKGYMLQNYGQAHYGYGLGEQNLNISIPFIASSRGYGIFFDNHSAGTFDIGNTNAYVLDFSSESGNMVYYFMEGTNYDDLLSNYTLLTGRQPLPPIWSLGYFQSRFGYENEEHARQMVDDMQNADFPLDAIILDLYWFGDPGTMGKLGWDFTKWHNPIKMMGDFKNLGIKTILITEPYFTQNSTNFNFIDQNNWFGNTSNGETYLLDNFWAGPAALMDFTKKESLDWMWNFYSARKAEGVAGWWSDLGEPENHPDDMVHKKGSAREVHNILSLLWAQSLYNNYADDYPDERVFNLIRSGYAGMQRYSTFPWSGDIQKTWEGLQAQVPIMLGMSMSGVGYMGSDLGGFTGNFNPELYTRWMQQGTFSPVMRAHGVNTITEPVYLSEPYKSIVRDFIKLRYKLLPYNYSLAWLNTISGRPLAMPMDYFDKQNTFLNNINDQYFWGEQMLVAPILEEGSNSRTVYFPSGKWIDFENNKTYAGQYYFSVDAPLGEIPVFIKAGSFLPLATPKMSTDYYNSDTLIVWYYPDNSQPNSEFKLYIDDGISKSSLENNNYDLIKYRGQITDDQITINIDKEGNGFMNSPNKRDVFFEIKRVNNQPLAVFKDNLEMNIVDNESVYFENEEAAFFDEESNILMLHFPWIGIPTEIIISGIGVGIEEFATQNPKTFILNNAVPNPFSSEVSLTLNILKIGYFDVSVYDIYGKEIVLQTRSFYQKGSSTIKWDGSDLSGYKMKNGIYIITIRDENGEKRNSKVVLLR